MNKYLSNYMNRESFYATPGFMCTAVFEQNVLILHDHLGLLIIMASFFLLVIRKPASSNTAS